MGMSTRARITSHHGRGGGGGDQRLGFGPDQEAPTRSPRRRRRRPQAVAEEAGSIISSLGRVRE